MKRLIWMAFVLVVAAVFFYLSRFWTLSLWPRSGLFGIEALRPQGSLVGQWLRGTDFAPFELLIWAVGAFLVLTVLQKLYDRLNPPPE
ncbi:hypothetical protein [uncultured Tateyamaria sp.]|uniref:hypothetical protein n=1 Tax=uncultured Tateyamaria sp. TaxID=455651 RepID=UPI002605264F|nr:hypothetical protein [uncultured Tateyamaria sp.]